MLWVEQPVGTGFSIGEVTATSQEEIAQDFIKFFKNFETIFGIKKFKIFVTGESYAGRYVPYISAAMLDAKDKTYYDVQGILDFPLPDAIWTTEFDIYCRGFGLRPRYWSIRLRTGGSPNRTICPGKQQYVRFQRIFHVRARESRQVVRICCLPWEILHIPSVRCSTSSILQLY